MYTFEISNKNSFGKYPCQVLKDGKPVTQGMTGLTLDHAKSLCEYYVEEYVKEDEKKKAKATAKIGRTVQVLLYT